jgi:hypothetical protein
MSSQCLGNFSYFRVVRAIRLGCIGFLRKLGLLAIRLGLLRLLDKSYWS